MGTLDLVARAETASIAHHSGNRPTEGQRLQVLLDEAGTEVDVNLNQR
jgi:hypothetical protein